MKIDFSAAKAFLDCPAFYQERHVHLLQKTRTDESLAFGKRIHWLLEDHFKPRTHTMTAEQSLADVDLEAEAQEMLAAYRNHYPNEDFEVIDVEKAFEVPIPGTDHSIVGKIDGVIRRDGRLGVLEHKTEKRGSTRNLPEARAADAQPAVYLWAAPYVYGEPFDFVLLDVLTRRSPAGREPCEFWRDTLERTEQQRADAIRTIVWVAENIEKLREGADDALWPQNRERCVIGRYKCEYYPLHVGDATETELIRIKKFEPAEDYIGPTNLPVVRESR